MIARRIAAVLAAAALIVGAIFLRDAIDDDSEAEAEPDPTPPAAQELLCITELASVCRALEADGGPTATFEDAGTTLDRLATLPDPADAPLWLTIEPFPAMVDELRVGAGLDPISARATKVAATPLGVALPTEAQADVLTQACRDDPLWRCIGERASDEWTELDGDAAWQTVDPLLGDVEGSAIALASWANAVAGYFGETDISSSRWELDPNFPAWLRRLARAVPETQQSGRSPLATLLNRASAVDIAATTDAEFAASGATDRGRVIRYPDPTMSAEAVLAIPGESAAPDGLQDDLAAALTDAGWEPAAAAGTPLPGAGVMIALRDVWAESK